MTDWNLSIVLIVPAAHREKANRLSCALGHDVLPGNTYSVPLSASGKDPATHYGCRTSAKQDFLGILVGAGAGQLPPELDLAAFDLTPTDVADILQDLVVSVRPAEDMQGHFEAVLEEYNLKRVEPEQDGMEP